MQSTPQASGRQAGVSVWCPEDLDADRLLICESARASLRACCGWGIASTPALPTMRVAVTPGE